jgi:osmotically inducible protein OsmC
MGGMNSLYTAEATAWGGREGRAASSDGNLDLQLRPPKELGGPDGGGATNPEQLLAAAWAGCFHSALKLVAKSEKLDVSESAVTVRVSLGMDDAGFGLTAAIEAELPGIDHDTAVALVNRSHEVCPFSKATLDNVPVTLAVTDS